MADLLETIRKAKAKKKTRETEGPPKRSPAGEVQARGDNQFLPPLENMTLGQIAEVRFRAGTIGNPQGEVEFLKTQFGPDRVHRNEEGDIIVDDKRLDPGPFAFITDPVEAAKEVGLDIVEGAGTLLQGGIAGAGATKGAAIGGAKGAAIGSAFGGPVGAGFGGLAGAAGGAILGGAVGDVAGNIARQGLSALAAGPEFEGTLGERAESIVGDVGTGALVTGFTGPGGAVLKGALPAAARGSGRLLSAASKRGRKFTAAGEAITDEARLGGLLEETVSKGTKERFTLTAGQLTGDEALLRAERRLGQIPAGEPLRAQKIKQVNQIGEFLDKQLEVYGGAPRGREALGRSVGRTVSDYRAALNDAAGAESRKLFSDAAKEGASISRRSTDAELGKILTEVAAGSDARAAREEARRLKKLLDQHTTDGQVAPEAWGQILSDHSAGSVNKKKIVEDASAEGNVRFSARIARAMADDLGSAAEAGGAGAESLVRARAVTAAAKAKDEEFTKGLVGAVLNKTEAELEGTIPELIEGSTPGQVSKLMVALTEANPAEANRVRAGFLQRLASTGERQALPGEDINAGKIIRAWRKDKSRELFSALYDGDRAGFGNVARAMEALDRITRQPSFRRAAGGKELTPGSLSAWVAKRFDGVPVLTSMAKTRGEAVVNFKDENIALLLGDPDGRKFLAGASRLLLAKPTPSNRQKLADAIGKMSAVVASEEPEREE